MKNSKIINLLDIEVVNEIINKEILSNENNMKLSEIYYYWLFECKGKEKVK